MPNLDTQIDVILGKLEMALETVNSGGESDLRLSDSEWETVNAARDAMAGARLELSESEIERADRRARVFEREIRDWDRAEIRRRMLAAKDAGDRVTCYLIGTFASDPMIRQEAMRLPGNMDLLQKVAAVGRLHGELHAARQIPADARARAAFIQGKPVIDPNTRERLRAADTERMNAAKSALRSEISF